MKNIKKSAFALAGALALTLTACSSNGASTGASSSAAEGAASGSAASSLSGTLNGAGASTQQNAQQAWRDGFTATNSGVQVNYDPTGSGTGREKFLGGSVQYAGSDDPLKDDELAKVSNACATDKIVELPVYISPIAVAYNLPGVDDLNLDADTIAKIFSGKITKWNDPAIAATNKGVDLPDTDIIPVNRADKSGTTGNFTGYLSEAAPDAWSYGSVEVWPESGTQSAEGTSGVVNLAAGTEGAITYADYSQIGDLKAAKVKAGDEFLAPTADAAAKIVDSSDDAAGASDTILTKDLKRDGSIAGAYPVVLVSYEIGCQQYKNASDGELVKSYFTYVVSQEGQKAATDAGAGNAPISDALREKAMAAINTIK
ncbi:phosphate ABC transporter substrate-binding protein PstS [Neoactinobaculum massilliense]|mgnify:CR=1 FL=1|uniref:phosphate ABC transporter substrate-binding protein PstS n=1 Tax=Neoactinobaculum massilliense TaxID=2364794 RepID=UPI000F54BAF8|nr:phosphate ABC transporter substrate-binding protein PstS [Neoactinobaculum massilliense]